MSKEDLMPPIGSPGGYIPTREDKQKGQAASVKKRYENGMIRRMMQEALAGRYDEDGNGNPISGAAALVASMLDKAVMKGDVEAAKFVRDTAGEKPTDRIETEDKKVTVVLNGFSADGQEGAEPDADDTD